jgi:hypothetical protein
MTNIVRDDNSWTRYYAELANQLRSSLHEQQIISKGFKAENERLKAEVLALEKDKERLEEASSSLCLALVGAWVFFNEDNPSVDSLRMAFDSTSPAQNEVANLLAELEASHD